LLDLAGVEVPAEQKVDGLCLTPLLEGTGDLAERPLIWHYPHYGNQGGEPSSILMEGDWKLIHYHEDGRDEFYHLGDDEAETTDLAATQPERTSGMRGRLDQWLKATEARMPTPNPKFDSAKREARWKYLQTTKIQGLEKQHAGFVAPDYKPNDNWWSSKRVGEPK